ncbi:hypothetical protein [Aeromonas hydrophila]
MKTISVNDWLISEVEIESITPTFYSESLNFKGSSIGTGLQRFTVSFRITTDTDSDARRLNALLLSLKGQQETFELDLGTNSSWFNPMTVPNSQGTLCTAQILTGATRMQLSTAQIPEGAYFQFPNDTKVFVITGKTGNQYEFYPACRSTVPAASQINFTNPRLRLRMDKNSYSMKMSRAQYITLSAKEDI